MITIVAAASKGGAGKSALIMGIASVLHAWRKRTIILDLDEQGSVSSWITDDHPDIPKPDQNLLTIESLALPGGEAAMITAVLERLSQIEAANQCDYLLIDTKGEQARLTAAIGAYSDHVLCPTNGHAMEFEPVVKTFMGLKAIIEQLGVEANADEIFKVILTKQKVIEAADIRFSQKTLRENFQTIGGPMESSSFNKAVLTGTTIDLLAGASKTVLATTRDSTLRAAARREYDRHTKAMAGLETMLKDVLGGDRA